jgi:hypothetical protein
VNNVVVFPKVKQGAPANSIDEILENMEVIRKEQVEMLIDDTLSYVFNRCYQEGYDLSADHCIKPTAMVVESLRAALYRTVGMSHALHDAAEKLFVDESQAAEQAERMMSNGPDSED